MNFKAINLNDLTHLSHLQPDDWPDIVPEFRFYAEADYCYPIKLSKEDLIIAIGTSIQFEDTAWLSHIIVDLRYRNQGIGSAITEYLINNLQEQSFQSILLIATELGRPVYEQFDFRPVCEYSYMKREPSYQQPFRSSFIEPYTTAHYPAIMELDRRVSGENREILLKDYLDDAHLFLEKDRLTGFYLPQLREGLIVAETERAAHALMQGKYSDGSITRAVIPCANKTGIGYLQQLGFSHSDRTGVRMIRGKEIDWKPDCLYSRIGGNFG